MTDKPGTKAESAALTRVSGGGLHLPNVHEGSSPSSGTNATVIPLVFAAANAPQRAALTPQQEAWLDRVFVLYEAAGVIGATYTWCEEENGALVDFGEYESVHTLGDPNIEAVVKGMARTMQLGPLVGLEGGKAE